MKAFFDDLAKSGLSDRVLVLCFSEFGRQLGENASAGTDHGTAGPVLLAGTSVSGGLHGEAPDLLKLTDNARDFNTDFRRINATVLSDWMHIDPVAVLDGSYERIPSLLA